MKTRIAIKQRKEILRIRIPKETHERLQSVADGVDMEVPELGKFLLGAASRLNPSKLHKAVAEMIATGEK